VTGGPCQLKATARVTTLLFDLDGTLVDMRRRGLEFRFMLRAFRRFYPAIRPWRFRRAFWQAANRLQVHGTDRTNYEVFLETLGAHSRVDMAALDRIVREFLRHDFSHLSDRFVPISGARETLELARRLEYRIVLATNPVWPLDAVLARLRAGGLADFTFDFISHSEVMTCCKPDPRYYRELLHRLQARGEECLMIGNDPRKDLPAKDANIGTFLIGTHRPDPRMDASGTLEDLCVWIAQGRDTAWPPDRRSYV
jgi:FMN phosphatase YigB (HAD superfamily)